MAHCSTRKKQPSSVPPLLAPLVGFPRSPLLFTPLLDFVSISVLSRSNSASWFCAAGEKGSTSMLSGPAAPRDEEETAGAFQGSLFAEMTERDKTDVKARGQTQTDKTIQYHSTNRQEFDFTAMPII